MSSPFVRSRPHENAIALADPTPLPSPMPSMRPGPRLNLPTGDELDALLAYGEIIVKSGLAPNHIKSAEAALVIMRFGHQLGIDEFTALQNMFVVGGKPAAMASLLHSLILRDHGGDAVQILESTATACKLRCRRRDSSHTTEISYTIEEAKAAGLVTPQSTWNKYPADLLFARAISRAGRQLFRDSTMGMYTPEEIGGTYVEVAGEVVDTSTRRPANDRPDTIAEAESISSTNRFARLHAIGVGLGLDHDALHRIGAFHGHPSLAALTETMLVDFETMVKEATDAELDLWSTNWSDAIETVEAEGGVDDLVALGERMKAAGITSRDHRALALAYKAALDRMSGTTA